MIENIITERLNDLAEQFAGGDWNWHIYSELYKNFKNDDLKHLLSGLQYGLNSSLELLNKRLPTEKSEGYFHADSSRFLLYFVHGIEDLEKDLSKTKYSFKLLDRCRETLRSLKKFIVERNGSSIPIGTDKFEIHYNEPIFISKDTIEVLNSSTRTTLTLIGAGSYANVHTYEDPRYDKQIVVKKAKKTLEEKDLKRIKKEFEVMKELNSPYIVDVYKYHDQDNSYTMEYMDFTLGDYIRKKNNVITMRERINIINQILKAFKYTASKKILHQDISPTNILIKKYDDTVVVKLSDFGLYKEDDNQLTVATTVVKGSWNDPSLHTIGFKKYNVQHEVYAITRIIYFVMTGKEKLQDCNASLKKFVEMGTASDMKMRFKDIEELCKGFEKLLRETLV